MEGPISAETLAAVDQLLLMQTLQKQFSSELRRKLEMCNRLFACEDYMVDYCSQAAADGMHIKTEMVGILNEVLSHWPDSSPLSYVSPQLG